MYISSLPSPQPHGISVNAKSFPKKTRCLNKSNERTLTSRQLHHKVDGHPCFPLSTSRHVWLPVPSLVPHCHPAVTSGSQCLPLFPTVTQLLRLAPSDSPWFPTVTLPSRLAPSASPGSPLSPSCQVWLPLPLPCSPLSPSHRVWLPVPPLVHHCHPAVTSGSQCLTLVPHCHLNHSASP